MLRPEFQRLADIERRRIVMPEDVYLRLNRLEKPEPWPNNLLLQIECAIKMQVGRVQEYPEYNSFYADLAEFVGVPVDSLVVGAGIEEFIRTLMFIAAAPGEKVAVTWPTCAMFEIYARAFGVELVRVVTKPGQRITADELLEQLPDDLRLFILPNPGQPVDVCFRPSSLAVIARALRERGAVLAVDEAYFGFGSETAAPIVGEHENMVVLRTFSKAFGAASIRLGYAIAGPRLARTLHAVRQSGEVSAMSMAVASVLMRCFLSCILPSIRDVCRARDDLRISISSGMQLRVWGRWANHVLIELPSTARRDAVRDALAARGVLVKADYPDPLARHMLVTCGSPALMARFYEEFRAVFDRE